MQLRDGTGLLQFSAEHTGRKTQRAWSVSQVTEMPGGNCQHAGQANLLPLARILKWLGYTFDQDCTALVKV